jgi:hypothetical protein
MVVVQSVCLDNGGGGGGGAIIAATAVGVAYGGTTVLAKMAAQAGQEQLPPTSLAGPDVPPTSGGYALGGRPDPLHLPGTALGGEFSGPLHTPPYGGQFQEPGQIPGFSLDPGIEWPSIMMSQGDDWTSGKLLTTNKGAVMKVFGLSKRDFNKIIHDVKSQVGDNPDMTFDLNTGDIFDQRSGEWVGSLLDFWE